MVVANPGARHGRARRDFSEIEAALASFAEVNWNLTRSAGHATELVATTDLSACDGVIAIGGDGTLFEVLNGLYSHPAESRTPLGLIPTGTGNAFARDLDLEPGDWPRAVEIIKNSRLRKVDVARVKTPVEVFYFLNIIGMGFATDAGMTARKLKILGNVAYTLGTLWQVLKLRTLPLRMEIDGVMFEQDNVFVEISNTRYTGTTFLIAPNARLDDGLLDLTILGKLSRLQLLKLFPTIYTGEHIRHEPVSTFQASRIVIHEPENLVLTPDGEFRGSTPAEIDCLKRDLEIFSPSPADPNP
jgi:YegS/Rv2252/BmrU family lipid kinase